MLFADTKVLICFRNSYDKQLLQLSFESNVNTVWVKAAESTITSKKKSLVKACAVNCPPSSSQNAPISHKKQKRKRSNSIIARLNSQKRVIVMSSGFPPMLGARCLSTFDDACKYLGQTCRNQSSISGVSPCVALLQRPMFSQYIFSVCNTTFETSQQSSSPRPMVALSEYLQQQAKERADVVHQLRLAKKLALGFLQYHPTPWLPEQWDISQVQLLASHNSEETSMYLLSRLPVQKQKQLQSALEPNDIQMTEGSVFPQHQDEIHNPALFYLAVAFLQIGYWKPRLEFTQENELNLLDTVRKLRDRPVGLGGLYDDIVETCLSWALDGEKDFGASSLQSDIWNTFVCPLDQLIQHMDNLHLS
jgi:hypothetical protein